ncbi:MAG: DUF2059 domain-containing protein [Akkermansiaceae bacterium]
MKQLLISIIALTTLGTSLAQAQEATKPAEELLELIKFKQVMTDVSNAGFAPFLNKLRKQGFPEAGVKEVKEAAEVYFDQVASDPDLKSEMTKLYEKEFTTEELKELVAFYRTPLGQKALNRLPALTQQGAKLGEKYALKHQAGFKGQMTRIMQKYKPAQAGEPKADGGE